MENWYSKSAGTGRMRILSLDGYCYLRAFGTRGAIVDALKRCRRYPCAGLVLDFVQTRVNVGDFYPHRRVFVEETELGYHVYRGTEGNLRLEDMFDHPTWAVGADATRIVEEAMITNGPQVALGAATTLFQAQMASAHSVPFNLPPATKVRAEKYVGVPLSVSAKSKYTGDHPEIAVARVLCRAYVDEQWKPHHTSVATLCVGAGNWEVRKYGANRAIDFYMPSFESKDPVRTAAEALGSVADNIRASRDPLFSSEVPGSVAVTLRGKKALYPLAGKNTIRSGAVITDIRDVKRVYSRLMFHDSLYEISERQLCDYFDRTGALDAYAVILLPNKFLDDSVPDSDFYHLEEVPSVKGVVEAINLYLPVISTVAAPLVGSAFCEFLNTFTRIALAFGWEKFLDLAVRVLDDAHPFLMLGGIGLDVVKIGLWMGYIREIALELKDRLVKTTLTYRRGHANGYAHTTHTWKKWATQRRFRHGPVCVDTEVVSRFGEMCVLRLWRSDGKTPIYYRPELPEQFRCMQILDLDASWDPYRCSLKSSLVYTSVYEKEFCELIAWAGAQAVDALDVDMMCAGIYRMRQGLSLMSTEIVPAWRVAPKVISNWAAVALLEVYKRKNILAKIVRDADYLTGFTAMVSDVIKKIAKISLFAMTGGLAWIGVQFWDWLWQAHGNVDFTLEPYEVPLHVENAVMVQTIVPEEYHYRVPTSRPNEHEADCEMCGFLEKGMFGEQLLHCGKKPGDKKKLDIDMGRKDMEGLLSLLAEAKVTHSAWGAHKVVASINAAKDFVEAHLDAGFSLSVDADYIEGGPGVGKSVIIRELANYYEGKGLNTLVLGPYNRLANDYTSAKLLDGTVKSFDYRTAMHGLKEKGHQVVLVDEASSYDVRTLVLQLVLNQATRVYIVGDPEQTGLQETEGFGTLRSDSIVRWQDIDEHRPYYNFRNPPLIVKILNRRGYKMASKRTDYVRPKYVTKGEPLHDDPAIVESGKRMVFAKVSMNTVFGVEAPVGEHSQEDKVTVRSQQGGTHDHVFLGLSEADAGLMEAHGMFNVAISRHKSSLTMVCAGSVDDPVPTRFRQLMGCDSDEDFKALISEPWPAPPVTCRKRKVEPEYATVRTAIREAAKLGDVKALPEVDNDGLEVQAAIEDAVYQNKLVEADRKATSDREREALEKKISDAEEVIAAQKQQVVSIQLATPHNLSESERHDLEQAMFSSVSWCTRDVLKSVKAPAAVIGTMVAELHRRAVEDMVAEVEAGRVVVFKGAGVDCELRDNGSSLYVADEGRFGVHTGHVFDILDDNHIPYVACRNHKDTWHPRGQDVQLFVSRCLGPKSKLRDYNLIALTRGHVALSTKRRAAEMMLAKRVSVKTSNLDTSVEATARVNGIPILNLCQRPYAYETDVPMHTFVASLTSSQVSGFNPTPVGLRKVTPLKFSSPTMNAIAETWAPAMPATIVADIREPRGARPGLAVPHLKPRDVKIGKDMQNLASYMDNTDVFQDKTGATSLHVLGALQGTKKEFRKGSRLVLDGLRFEYTKSGKVKMWKPRFYRSVTIGKGLHQNRCNTETLLSSQRYLTKRPRARYSMEGVMDARRRARMFFESNFRRNVSLDPLVLAAIREEAFRDMAARNYPGRAQKEMDALRPILEVSYHNKAQFKPEKNGQVKLTKIGQGIAQTGALWNLKHCVTMRALNYGFKSACKDHFFYDNIVPKQEFRESFTRAVAAVTPSSAMVAISDGQEFDSNQDYYSVAFEEETSRLQGASNEYIASYYRCRRPLKMRAFGLFSGMTDGEKGSGFLDTLLGNTKVGSGFATTCVTGLGPKVEAGKGDDWLRVQSSMKIDETELQKVEMYSSMKLDFKITRKGGEFCGEVVTREGMYPSITRAMLKALAAKHWTYKDFTERQKAYRDAVAEINSCGYQKTVAANVVAEGRDAASVETNYGILNAMSHLSKEQWKRATKVRGSIKVWFPGASGHGSFDVGTGFRDVPDQLTFRR